MDARADIEGRMLNRRKAAGSSCESVDGGQAAVQICKNAPELKRRSRDVAKELYVDGGIPLLMKTLLDNGHLRGDCTTASGRTIAENLKSERSNLRHGLARRAPDGAIEVAGMLKVTGPEVRVGGAVGLLQDGDMPGVALAAQIINGNLTGVRLAERQTKPQLGETNHRSGARWKYAQQVGPAMGGAVIRSGGAHEKQCYDI